VAFVQQHLVILSSYALLLIFAGAMIGGETIAFLASILCHRNGLPVQWVFLVALLAGIIGNLFLYYLGRRFGDAILVHHPRLQTDVLRFRSWLRNKASLLAFGSRFVYGAGVIGPILLGINRFPLPRYFLLNAVSAGLWAAMVVAIGYLMGSKAESLLDNIQYLEQILFVVILLILLRWLYRHRFLTMHKQQSKEHV